MQQLMQSYPHSRWLEEALYSGGNMYLIQHDERPRYRRLHGAGRAISRTASMRPRTTGTPRG